MRRRLALGSAHQRYVAALVAGMIIDIASLLIVTVLSDRADGREWPG